MKKTKVIDFMERKKNKETEDYDGFEDWEADNYFIDKKDYEGLKKHREAAVRSNPKDIYCQLRLGEAYILNKENEEALVFLSKLHNKYPDIEDVQFYILDALFELGKSENDFEWIIKPVILKVEDAGGLCVEMLRNKRKGVKIVELYCNLMGDKYLTFKEDELFNALNEDERFEVEIDDMITAFSRVRYISRSKKRS